MAAHTFLEANAIDGQGQGQGNAITLQDGVNAYPRALDSAFGYVTFRSRSSWSANALLLN